MTDGWLRAQIADQLETEIRPLISKGQDEDPPGYDCCGCSTYREILDHAIRIVRGEILTSSTPQPPSH